MERRNINRGYMKLTVWQDAIAFYVHTVAVFRNWPYEMRRVAAQQIAGVDSIHRNIAEGYGAQVVKGVPPVSELRSKLCRRIGIGAPCVPCKRSTDRARIRGDGCRSLQDRERSQTSHRKSSEEATRRNLAR
ncbi:MAG: four helix bundle protein [Planctomycetes bacterium]|nr:four helix bundle protein [Planctomycetota bacterium]